MSQPKILRLKHRHGWKCKRGYKIFVLDRGAVRFDVPQDWIVKIQETSVKMHDQEPPGDNCTLEVSNFRLPPIDWTGLPMRELLAGSVGESEQQELERSEIVESCRGDLELAWLETRYIDKEQQREAKTRISISRTIGVACLITYCYWADQSAQWEAVWEEVHRSMVLGVYVQDPTKGPVIH